MSRLILIFTIIGCFFSSPLWANVDIHFSKVQFYLNDNTRTSSMKMKNQGNHGANCSIGLAQHLISNDGQIKSVSGSNEGVYNSAKELVRYSPRKVDVPSGSSQVVRISFRRIPNLDDGEYISYLRVKCIEDKQETPVLGKISASAVVYYNLPVVIRHGDINSENKIVSAKMFTENGNSYVVAEHQRLPGATGSIIGNYEVIGKDSEKVYGSLTSGKVYAPARYRKQKFNLTETPNEPVQLKFTMNPQLGEQVTIVDILD